MDGRLRLKTEELDIIVIEFWVWKLGKNDNSKFQNNERPRRIQLAWEPKLHAKQTIRNRNVMKPYLIGCYFVILLWQVISELLWNGAGIGRLPVSLASRETSNILHMALAAYIKERKTRHQSVFCCFRKLPHVSLKGSEKVSGQNYLTVLAIFIPILWPYGQDYLVYYAELHSLFLDEFNSTKHA